MKRELRILIYKILFGIYAAGMIYLLFFKDRGYFKTGDYSQDLFYHLQYKPFLTIKGYLKVIENAYINHRNFGTPFNLRRGSSLWYGVSNFFGNIILFVPLGLFLTAIKRRFRKLKRFVPMVIVILVAIETVQLFTLRGVFDVDDIILNFFGAICGFILAIPLRHTRRRFDHRIEKNRRKKATVKAE
ncbi:MAG: VanZ family protein [Lachnospiraceae bacterium]|nr:VanZ family protein [Lachnospiraceae bacterium]